MVEVRFISHNKQITVPRGTSLLDAAHQSGVIIESPCNREGTCRKCKVFLYPEDLENVRYERGCHSLTAQDEANGYMLSCQVYIHGNVRVKVPERVQPMLAIVADGKCRQVSIDPFIVKSYDPERGTTCVTAGPHVLKTEIGDTTAQLYGVAIDIGTTTLVVALLDLRSGKVLHSNSALNPQALHAQDILSRIKLGSTDEGLTLLHSELLHELNRMIGALAASENIDRSMLYEAILSGNTTMLTMAASTSPASLGKYPYQVELQTGCSFSADKLGLQIAEQGKVWFPPVASAYVGADITSGIMAADLSRLKGITLFVDIGTNGEMVLAENGKLTATSTAAGPAFEGMNISCGMRAVAGAIEKVFLNKGTVEMQTISGAKPIGLCGSGLMDAVAELSREGVVDRNGRLAKPGSEIFQTWQHHFEIEQGRVRFKFTDKVTLTQQDIRQVQLAKAAVRAGIDLMLLSCSHIPEEVDRVFIAGSFGAHLQVSSLIALGLLPNSFADRVEFLGNTSQSGAVAFLLNRKLRLDTESMVTQMKVLELSREPEFEKIFLKALAFPQCRKQPEECIHGA
ncbi:MAG: ASKHA domain-containing protein [Chlorobiales bacterium]|nr:ASKHA domain-containing protein [Chlorobiales bacterium]